MGVLKQRRLIMGKSRGLSGGGIETRKLVHPKVQVGKGYKDHVSPGGVSEIGSAMGSKLKAGSLGNSYINESAAQQVMRGRVPHPAPGLGNAVALNVGRGGPGAGRTIYGQGGTQKTYGPVVQGASRPER